MIRFNDVSKMYGSFRAVHNVNLHIREGELVTLIGPSGSGKTTTMKMINRLIEPSGGTILINGKPVSEHNVVELRRNIGYVIQNIGLLPHMTLAENIAIVPKMQKWDKARYEARVDELLALVGLNPAQYRNRYPAELSGGQQQRIGVIRALAADPAIVLMDEPYSALDPISREQLQDEVLRLQQTLQKTIVFVTHDIDEAIKMGDRICIMNQGQIVQMDTPENILRHPADEFVSAFIGSKRMSQLEMLPPIEEVMIRPVTARPNRGLAEAINTMRRQKVDSLIIVDQHNAFLGVAGVWEIQQHFYQEKMTLEDVMQKDVPVLLANQSLSEAIYLISKHQVAYLPVINDSHELLGIVNRASLVDIMARQVRHEVNCSRGGAEAC
ncbi:osmoprotectant transport system ATP-binding protein [Anaerospora hongkongensis]|uniref:Quaternary amine transport ATP-binding protein n=1 Tax=Anaerospora hongkongensis TaxID=244830 RepID=A0A4R1PZN2_9FIRM|nr:ABC transporter ATP-binding protein [Anaerospora hongkongensis]TCL38616.1 osmoprotectant transport system ATP-binding protein [Anaerospora hongkongensis]